MNKKSIKTIANYEILESIQETSEWIFYQAFDNANNKVVFLKVYLPSLKWADESLNEFLDRLNYLKFFEHEYLFPILDFGKHNKVPYVVFPKTTGEFFDSYISQSHYQKEFIPLFLKIAQALNTLHTQDIIHGLLTPGSIFIDTQNRPLLLDYGISEILRKVLIENVDENFQNLSATTVKFSSPEQLLGRSPQKASDVYSFGALFYFWAFGELPIDEKSVPEMAMFHVNPKNSWLSSKPRNLSKAAFDVLQKCLKKIPEERFVGFAEIEKRLARMQNSRKSHVQTLKPAPISRKKSQKKIWFFSGAAIVLTLAGLLLWQLPNIYFVKNSPPVSRIEAPDTPTDAPPTALTNPTIAPSEIPTATSVAPTNASEETITSSETYQKQYKPAIVEEKIEIGNILISTQNIEKLQEISRLGYGRPEDIATTIKYKAFAVATSAGVFIYDNNSTELLTWIDPGGWATSVCFSDSGDFLAIGLLSGDIQVWNWQEETLTATLAEHKGKVSRILFSSNDRFIYSASYDQNIILWNLNSQESMRTIRAHSSPIREIVVSSDGRYLASGASDQVVRLWDISSGSRIHEFPFPGKVETIAISPDDEYIAVGGESGFIRQWNIKSRQLRTDPIPVKARIFDVKYLGTNTLFAGLEDSKFETYSPQKQKYPGISLDFQAIPTESHLVRIFGPQFEFNTIFANFGDTSNIISAEWNGKLSKNRQVIWEPNYDIIDQLNFSPNSSFLATSGKRELAKIWDIKTNRIIYQAASKLPVGNTFSHDSATITLIRPRPVGVANVSERYYLLDLKSKGHTNLSDAITAGSVSFTSDNSLVVSANLSTSKVWDTITGYEVFFRTRRDSNCWITFSANNDEVLQVSSAAGTFLEWDERIKNICLRSLGQSMSTVSKNFALFAYVISNGQLEAFSPSENRPLWRYQPSETITALSISPDGSIIALGSPSGKLSFIDGKKGELIFEKTGNYGAITLIKFSAQGNILATIGTDGTTRLFTVTLTP